MAFFEMLVGGSVMFYYLILWNHYQNQTKDSTSQGIQKEVNTSLKKIKVRQKQIDKQEQCSICYYDFIVNELVPQLQCEHIFHQKCIATWLEIHAICPLCRHPQNNISEAQTLQSQHQESLEIIPNFIRTYCTYQYR